MMALKGFGLPPPMLAFL